MRSLTFLASCWNGTMRHDPLFTRRTHSHRALGESRNSKSDLVSTPCPEPRTTPAHHCVVQIEFPLLERHHLFLDTMAHENPHDRDSPLLPDAVRAIRRLVFHRRIPPGVQMKHIARFGEIEPLPPCFET